MVSGNSNNYRDMWRNHANKLSRLSKLCYDKVKFEWNYVEQKAFNCKEELKTHIDTRNTKLGIIINRKWDFHSLLLTQVNPCLINYTNTVIFFNSLPCY